MATNDSADRTAPAAARDDIRAARTMLAWLTEPGDPEVLRLIGEHGPAGALAALSDESLIALARWELRGRTPRVLREGAQRIADTAVETCYGLPPVRVLIPEDDDWPAGVPANSAVCLWACGSVPPPGLRSAAVTGARAATSYGRHVAAELAAGLHERGYTVATASGFGIAEAAQLALMQAAAAPVVVLPGGVDRLFPTAHHDRLVRIARSGLLLTASPRGAEVTRTRTITAGRLLAGLTGGTVVVEAAPVGGPLLVALHAAALGRAAMAVPGPVTSALSAGCHRIIRDDPRVRLVTSAQDVAAAIGDHLPAAADESPDGAAAR